MSVEASGVLGQPGAPDGVHDPALGDTLGPPCDERYVALDRKAAPSCSGTVRGRAIGRLLQATGALPLHRVLAGPRYEISLVGTVLRHGEFADGDHRVHRRGVARQRDGTTRSPVAWDHFWGSVRSGAGMIVGVPGTRQGPR
jgi:hypothetical protein